MYIARRPRGSSLPPPAQGREEPTRSTPDGGSPQSCPLSTVGERDETVQEHFLTVVINQQYISIYCMCKRVLVFL
jgi:hypothetical protein